MKKISAISISTLIGVTLMAGTAFATVPPAQNNGNNNGAITILGNVQSVNNAREFMLQTGNGNFDVQMTTNQSLKLAQGEEVIVSGTIDGNIVKATTVRVKRDDGAALNKALSSLPHSTSNLAAANQLRPQPANQVGTTTADSAQGSAGIQLRNTAGQPARATDTNSVSDAYATQGGQLTAITGAIKNNTNRTTPSADNSIARTVGAEQYPAQQ